MSLLRSSLVALSAVTFFVAGFSDANAADKIGVVGNISGAVNALSSSGEMRSLKAGDAVYLNDVIDSGASGKAQIMFLDKSSLMVNPGTKVTVDRFVYNPATAGGELSINSAKGALRFIGGALSKEKPVTIKTPVATIGIRGGIADAHIGQGGATDAIFVFGDELTVANAQGQTQSLTTPGQGLSVLTANSLPQPLPPERVMQRLASFADNAGSADQPSGDATGDEATTTEGSSNSDNASGAGESKGDEGSAASDETTSGGDEQPANSPESAAPVESKGDGKGPDGTSQGKPAGSEGNSAKPALSGNNSGVANRGPAAMPQPPAGTNLANVNVPVNNVTQGNLRNNNINNNQQVIEEVRNPFVPSDNGIFVMQGSPERNVFLVGKAGYKKVNERFDGRVQYDFPGGSIVTPVNLPWLSQPGYQSVNGGSFGNVPMHGHAYRSPDGSLQYYDLKNTHNNLFVSTLTGRVAGTESWASSAYASGRPAANKPAGFAFYDFLPEMSRIADGTPGFFDYNLADNRLFDTSGNRENNLGMVVNWDAGRYLTGRVNWNATAVDDEFERGIVVAFGKTLQNGNLLDGRVLHWGSLMLDGEQDMGGESGYLRSRLAYSASNGGAFSGMLLEGVIPENEYLTSGQAFNPAADGQRIYQPVVQGSTTAGLNASINGSNGATKKGFAAGFVVTNTTSGSTESNQYLRVGNQHAGDVNISFNPNDRTMLGKMKLEGTNDGTSDKYVYGEFGSGTGANRPDNSAYVTDELYAAEQGYYKVFNGSSFTTYDNQRVSGGIVGASLIADTPGCTNCEFVDWGVWAGEIDRGSNTYTDVRDVVAMVPYVSGQITENLAGLSGASGLGVVSYTGPMMGSVLQNGTLSRHTGDFTASIDLNQRTLKSFAGDFAGMQFATGMMNRTIPGTGLATFQDVSVHGIGSEPSGSITGVINGALFGNAAQDIGGNFAIQNAVTDAQAAGIYIGTRQ